MSIGYGGALDSSHLRACIRVALRAHGFSLSTEHYRAAAEQQWRRGCWLRDEVFPRAIPGQLVAEYAALCQTDPELWNRLPLMGALGFWQAQVLHDLDENPSDCRDGVAQLGGTFNAAVSVLDYLVDERTDTGWVFELLQGGLLSDIFEHPAKAQTQLERAYASAADPASRVLCALILQCARFGNEVLERSGNTTAWRALGQLIRRLFEAEWFVSTPGPVTAPSDVFNASETKSALPSVALLWISTLSSGSRTEPSSSSLAAARNLGHIVWRIDDLTDLVDDLERAAPNALCCRIAERVAKGNRACAADADLYDEIDATAGEILQLLTPASFGRSDSEDWSAETAELLRLAYTIVAGWAGWHEEDSSHLVRRPIFDSTDPLSGPLNAAARRLVAFQKDGFQEAVHHLRLPRILPHGLHYETFPALLSHRAVAFDALADAYQAGLPVPYRALNAEALAMLRSKHRHVRGGWNYIEQVTELPPDCDDLGQVLQALYWLGGAALASTCEDGLRLACDAIDPDGGINTWIIDYGSHALADESVLAYLPVMGGWGVHSEVVANLLSGILLYDRERFDQQLRQSARYLVSVQEEAGFWKSKWYAGPYYGTYKVVAVLNQLVPTNPHLTTSLERAKTFVLDAQNADGGWGEHRSEPLSTALALLALSETCGHNDVEDAHTSGLKWLLTTQASDGSWAACPWIAFPTVDGLVVHGSSTITTAFCLKALIAHPLATRAAAGHSRTSASANMGAAVAGDPGEVTCRQ